MLSAISWNVYTNHNVGDVLHELRAMIHYADPDVIALYEAKHLFHHLEGLGYNVYQLKSKTARKGLRPATANVALLVRKQIKVRKTFTIRMNEVWKGPHKGAPQSPRVYRWLKLENQGSVWRIGGFHIPFGNAARHESFARLRAWLKNAKGRPTVALGDYNSGKTFVRDNVGKFVGGKVVGEGIDLATLLNCRLTRQENLGHHGSDHPAILYILKEHSHGRERNSSGARDGSGPRLGLA